MGDNLDNTSENEQGLTSDCPSSADDAQVSQATRRKFTRNVVMGGAVLASLGNRAAWGQIPPAPGCMSVAGLVSFTTTDFLSPQPGFNYTLADDIVKVQNNPDSYPTVELVHKDDGDVCIVAVGGDEGPGLGAPETLYKGRKQREKEKSWLPEP